jgi:hypothetical protein
VLQQTGLSLAAERRYVGRTRMARSVDLPGIGILREEQYGNLVSEALPIAALAGRDCHFVFDGFEGDPHPEDFIQAVRNVMAADESLLAAATGHVHQYCIDMQTLWGEAAPTLDISKPADVWRYVDLGTQLSVSRDHDSGRDVFVSLECNCAWEIEHGLQLVFRNGNEITKVGPFDGPLSNESAYADERLRGVIYKRLGY